MATFVYVIFGMIKFLVKNSTVSEIRSAPVLGMYALWHMYCSKAGPMYQPGSPRDDMIFYRLAYCELLLLYLLGIAVCSCNITLHRYGCIAIGVDGVFISTVDLGLLLLAVSF